MFKHNPLHKIAWNIAWVGAVSVGEPHRSAGFLGGTQAPRGRSAGVLSLLSAAALNVVCCGELMSQTTNQPGLLSTEFIFAAENAPFAQCHASTIAEAKGGLVAAWFGGTAEKNPDVGIWLSRVMNGVWTAPVEVANGRQKDGSRFACWNPVLFQPQSGPLMLFYKVGPSPSRWWGLLTTSADGGVTWSAPGRLPTGILGPIKNKPVQFPDGDILCPSSTENHGWQVHFERTRDLGKTWETTPAVNDGEEFDAIQPSLLTHGGNQVEAIGRTRQSRMFEIWSGDKGKTWSKMKAGSLPNPNSGIDAVTLKDGRQLVVYNHTERGRSPLNVSVSIGGQRWQAALVLESTPGEYSYPAVIEASDGLVHVTFTWKRVRIKHVVIEPAKLRLRPILEGKWPDGGD